MEITLTPILSQFQGDFYLFLNQNRGSKSIQLDAKDNFRIPRHSKILQPIPFNNWIIIFEKIGYREKIENLIKDMQRYGSIMGIKIRSPMFRGGFD